MDLITGLGLSLLLMVVGALGLTCFAIHLSKNGSESAKGQKEIDETDFATNHCLAVLERRLTIKFGCMFIVATGIIIASMKLIISW